MVAQEEQWRGRLERVVQAVEAWQRLLADGLHNVEPGSALAGDDDRSQGALPSSFAWHGIATAVDHLGMLVDLLGGQTVRLRVFAPFTVARTALIGGSQAVWLLAPPKRSERLVRAAMVEADEHKHYATYLRDYKRDPFVRGEVTPALASPFHGGASVAACR